MDTLPRLAKRHALEAPEVPGAAAAYDNVVVAVPALSAPSMVDNESPGNGAGHGIRMS